VGVKPKVRVVKLDATVPILLLPRRKPGWVEAGLRACVSSSCDAFPGVAPVCPRQPILIPQWRVVAVVHAYRGGGRSRFTRDSRSLRLVL